MTDEHPESMAHESNVQRLPPPRPQESAPETQSVDDPFTAPVPEDEWKAFAPRFFKKKALLKVWLGAVNALYEARRKRYEELLSLSQDEKERLKLKVRRVLIIVSASENTRGMTAVFLIVVAILLFAPVVVVLSGSVVVKSYLATSGTDIMKSAAAVASVPTTVLLFFTLLYISFATPTIIRIGSIQSLLISILIYFALTRYSDNQPVQIAVAVISLLVLPLRLGVRKWFVRVPLIFLVITSLVMLWLGAYGVVIVSVADVLVVSVGVMFVVGSVTGFLWVLGGRQAQRRYPAEFIVDKLLEALSAFERLRKEEAADSTGNIAVNKTEAGRKQVVRNLKDAALLLGGPLPKALAVSDSKMDAEILSQFRACAASVRGVAVGVAVPRGSDATLASLQHLFVESADEEWGAFRDVAPADSVAFKKTFAFGQILLHVGVALAAIGGVYFLEVTRPGQLNSDFRNAVAVPLVIVAIQQIASIFDQRAADNGITILRDEAEVLRKNR